MATATTTAKLIREDRRDIVRNLRPAELANVGFSEYDRNADFREWCEDNSTSCFRRFQIEDQATYEPPVISDFAIEETRTQFTVVVAYPADGRFRGGTINAVEDAIRADQVKIDTRLGVLNYGSYPSGLDLFQLVETEIERDGDVWFLVSTYDCIFKRAVDLGFTNLVGSAAISIVVSAIESISFNESATLPLALTVSGSETFTDGGIDQTIEGILTAADPMQELIDAMSFATKPDYMWGGDEASGATEIGGSGFDLGVVSTPLQSQTSSVLGSGDFTVFNSSSDSLANTSDSALQPGSGSYAVLWIGSFTDLLSTRYFFGDRDSTGWQLYRQSAGQIVWYLQGSGGGQALTVTGHSADTMIVVLAIIDQTANESDLWTGQGSGNRAIDAGSYNPVTQKMAVGDGSVSSSANMEWGIGAIWKGAVAESLTSTHRSNLATFLGAS